jgi:flavin-dependent dehydrogenase
MWDVVIAGAGPAGTVAATILARAGARVLIVDRARFPRDKLCGDSLNPGTLALLRRLDLSSWVEAHGHLIEGMLVTGPFGTRVEGRYPAPLIGRTVLRRDLDYWLLGEAIRAGAQFEEGVVVRRALVGHDNKRPHNGVCVGGVGAMSRSNRELALKARVTIAADGRRSALAFGLGLASHAVRPRRWALGAYFEGVSDTSRLGEMHIGADEYIGVAPLAGGLTNTCFVAPSGSFAYAGGPEHTLNAAINRHPSLRRRFATARLATPPMMLGPLAVDTVEAGLPGLLLAGDAAGFVDPMTGDGLRFAVRGAELAAEAALELLTTGNLQVHVALAARRKAEFIWKWRLNRLLRRVVDSPSCVSTVARCAAVAPAFIRWLVSVAGDCPAAEPAESLRSA